MKKTQIQEILDLSSLTMVDPEYTIFTRYILSGQYTDARLFIEAFIENHEGIRDDEDSTEYLDKLKRCDKLENLVIDLIINNEDVKHDKPKRVRRRIVN